MDVLTVLRAVAPDVAATAVGVPAETIRAVEGAVGVEFPAAYRSFLLTMGESTAGFHFGSSSQSTRLADLVAELEPPEQRVARYWRITVEHDLYNPVAADFYLDLPTSDGDDAEILELCYPPDGDEVPDIVRYSFVDHLRERVFYSYVCPIEDKTSCSLHVDKAANPHAVDLALRHVLQHEGLSEFMPYRDKVALFARAECSAVVDYPWQPGVTGVSIFVRAKRRDDALLLVEKLRDHIPAPVHVSPPRR